jgi:predicted nucleic acid-binding protein
MRAILDSSALVALMNEDDALHVDAIAIRDLIRGTDYELLLPYEVCAETLNVIGRNLGRDTAATVGRVILDLWVDEEIIFVNSDPQVVSRAIEWQKDGKGAPSFVDSLVMAVADHNGTPYIFGFDATFKKNGYVFPSAKV